MKQILNIPCSNSDEYVAFYSSLERQQTACYTRHGGSALLAVEGLTTLLREKFFASDVNMEQDSSSRITLLDVVVQVVCDVATMGAQETHLQACVEFVEAAVKYGCGHLNTRSVGYVLRFYLFVFYFGVSSPCGAWGLVKGRDQYLLDNPRDSGLNYLPGGTPQSATLSLKDLISYSIARLRSLTTADQIAQGDRTNLSRGEDKVEPEVFNILIDELVEEIVDVSVSRVDIANYTQLAMHQIHRSGGSELFWSDMLNCCGTGLFGNDLALRKETRNMYSMCFALLANCVKVASSKMRKDRNSEGIPRDVASKLMSLEMLYFFLEKWEENSDFMHVQESRSFVTFAFCVRRLVVPCLLSNTKETLDDPRVYRRVIRIVGILLCSPIYRVHMKLELGILMEHFVIKILRLGPQILHKKPKGEGDKTYLFAQQIELMKELKKWFGDEPRGLLELFLNFDTESGTQQVGGTKELLSGIQWKISQQICASLCSLSEKCGEFIAEQIRESQSMKAMTSPKAGMEVDEILEGVSGMTLARESAQRLRKAAVDAISQIVQCLALSAASARGHQLGALVKSWNTNKTNIAIARDFSRNGDSSSREFSYDGSSSSSRTSIVSEGDREDRRHPSILGYWQKAIAKRADETKKGNNSEEETGDTGGAVSPVYSGYQRSEEKGGTSVKIDHLGIAFEIAREKGLNKAIDYLIACNILTPSPRDIASFLRIHRAELRPADLGKYLGEGGTDRSETEYWNLIRFSYIRAISFEGMTVEQG